jgi:L-alanine-DL-glutamate epimerase-like enolase superfamily enzyme
MHAIELANALAEFEPYWFEEPCQSENVEALAEVHRASRIPVVTGDALLTRAGFRPIIRAPSPTAWVKCYINLEYIAALAAVHTNLVTGFSDSHCEEKSPASTNRWAQRRHGVGSIDINF